MLHDPGPRGSPHIPHDPAACCDGRPPPLVLTANAESSFWRSALAQGGQLGDPPPRVRYSKWWPQARHSYSNNGMMLTFCAPDLRHVQ
jgi:hypothetical protein